MENTASPTALAEAENQAPDLGITQNANVAKRPRSTYAAMFRAEGAVAAPAPDATAQATRPTGDLSWFEQAGDDDGLDVGEDEEEQAEESPDDVFVLPETDAQRLSKKASNRFQTLANRAREAETARLQLQEQTETLRKQYDDLRAQQEAWNPLLEQARSLGYNSAAEYQADVESQQRLTNYANQLRADIDEGRILEEVANIQYQLAQAHEKNEKQRKLDQQRIAQTEKTLSEMRTKAETMEALTLYPVIGEKKAQAFVDSMVKSGMSPKDAAKTVADFLAQYGAVHQTNAVANGTAPARRPGQPNRSAPPVSTGRPNVPDVGVTPGQPRTGKNLLEYARRVGMRQLFKEQARNKSL